MRVFFAASGVAGMLLFTSPSFAAGSLHPHHRSSTHAMVARSTSHSAHHVEQHAYERASMAPERATEIQSALIKQGYLTGEATGSWDSASISAMQRMQSDNGWQTKLVPDSRALIKLGLGPGTEPVSPVAAPTAATAVEAPARN